MKRADQPKQNGSAPRSKSSGKDHKDGTRDASRVRSRSSAFPKRPIAIAGKKQQAHVFLSKQLDEFWHKIGIFPQALKPLGRLTTIHTEASRAPTNIGVGNLRLLCEEAGIPRPDDASDRVLSGLLIAACDPPTVSHLHEFLRRRTEAVDAVFERVLSQRRRSGLQASVRDLSPRAPEVLKSFTKLLLLYRDDPDNLQLIHGQALWQSRPTSFEFLVADPLPARFARSICEAAESLTGVLRQAAGRRAIKFLGTSKLCDGMTVFSFAREFSPVVRADFRQEYVVYHGCGLILFGVDASRHRVFVKSGSRQLATAIGDFLANLFKVEVSLVYNDVFAEYTIEDLANRILGTYAEDQGIQIIAASFARSGFESHGPLMLGASPLSTSIRKDLEHIRHEELVEIRGPADIVSLTLTFMGRPIVVTSIAVDGGAVRFSYDDAGWDTHTQDEFQAAFFAAFGIPLNRVLHPGRAQFGSTSVYAALLGVGDEDRVLPYQEDYLTRLLDLGLLRRDPIASRTCRNNFCSIRNKPVDDQTRTTCPECARELHEWTFNRLVRDDDKIASFVADILDRADDWQLKGKERKLERVTYYELFRSKPDGREDSVCMLISDRPAGPAKSIFKRTGLPLLIVRTNTDPRHIYVDDDGIAHVSLAYLLSASESTETQEQLQQQSCSTMQQLVQNHEERVLLAARLSYRRLRDNNVKLTGDDYEDDAFNLLRSIFPYTYELAQKGEIEPDGYVCVPLYESDSIADVGSWNWSYDAKYTDKSRPRKSGKKKGYNLNIDECRKIVNYFKKLRRNRKALFGEKRQLRAHVIISNDLPEEAMERAAKFVFGPDGVGDKCKDIRLLLMQEGFLLRLYEHVRDNYEQIVRRRPFFGDAFVALLKATPQCGYAVLRESDADDLINRVLENPAVEENIDPKALRESLSDD